jgi:hypothetical protein
VISAIDIHSLGALARIEKSSEFGRSGLFIGEKRPPPPVAAAYLMARFS